MPRRAKNVFSELVSAQYWGLVPGLALRPLRDGVRRGECSGDDRVNLGSGRVEQLEIVGVGREFHLDVGPH